MDEDTVLPPYDCLSCGACCTGNNFRVPGKYGHRIPKPSTLELWIDCKEYHVRYAVELYEHEVTKFQGTISGTCPVRRSTRHFLPVINEQCIMLEGTVGKNVSCKVYNTRPKLCKKFDVGSWECIEQRKQAGLHVNLPVWAL